MTTNQNKTCVVKIFQTWHTKSVHRSDGGELSHRLHDDPRLHVLPEERGLERERDDSELDDVSEDDPELEDPERDTTSSVAISSSVSEESSVSEVSEKLKSCNILKQVKF